MGYRLVITGWEGPGIDGGITGRPHEGVAGVNYVAVEPIEDHLTKVQSGGGRAPQPKIPVPGVGFVAICQDTEGNPIGFFQGDEGSAY